MSPHLASLGKRKIRTFSKAVESWSDAEPVAQSSWASSPSLGGDEVRVEPSPWKRQVAIGAIVGSEFAVILVLLASVVRGSTDRRQFAWTLGILSVTLLALSLLRRKALPTASEY
ncbi:hypothetical protein [Singulisphaera acidiphila]|uniref:Uncharacterized protein n=1 Tax=Singulisphaera acidiphila (strain ATCC BAA-1392 / DSM 18658 / VKM B-2454 / MOB10) TaxID=886293 RepID=L0D8E8_SINAD|nr:hypothetical protein [Singulisphaera acidiphila]AGA25145.1 hypothetical protein Sinac_0735 [Singulisphaera acidiphila DSM 18658]